MESGLKKIVLLSLVLAFSCIVIFSFYAYSTFEQSIRMHSRSFGIFFMCTFMVSISGAVFCFAIGKIISNEVKSGQAIRADGDKYWKLFENNPSPMMIFNKATNRFLDVNNEALKQYGYARDEFLSLSIMSIQPEEDRNILFDKYKYLIATDESSSIVKHKRKDGSFVDVRITNRDIFFKNADCMLVLANDITVLLKTQEENRRLAAVLENTSDFVTLSDLEFKTIYANKAARKIRQNEESEDLSQKGFLDYLPAENRAYFTENIFPVAFVQGIWRGEATWIGKDQKEIPVSQVMLIEKPWNGTSGFIASIARDISETKGKESEIKKMNEQLRALAASLQNIREEERSNMAREIHDDLGQQLTAIKIDVSWIAKKIHDDEVSKRLNGIISMINETVKSIRKISTQLRPGILDDLGLIEALKWQAEEFKKRYEIAVDFVCNKDRLVLDQPIATGLFRIFQEALTNIARHANATLVKISLRIIGQELVLHVQDNGIGFEMYEAQAQKTLGLFGMKERTLMMGGHLEINSAQGKGVSLEINVPINIQE